MTPWLDPSSLVCPWDFAGKNTGVGCYFLLQGSSWLRNLIHISCIGRQIPYHWTTSKAQEWPRPCKLHRVIWAWGGPSGRGGFQTPYHQMGIWNRRLPPAFQGKTSFWFSVLQTHVNKQMPYLLEKPWVDTWTALLVNASLLWGYYSLLCTLAGAERGN